MKYIYYYLLLFTFSVQAQITSLDIESSILGLTRTVDLFVPETDDSDSQRMPLIVVLEGNEIFNIVVSNVQFLSKIGYMPKSIVVGIRQENMQVSLDCEMNKSTGQLTKRGYNFKQFITTDIVNRLSAKYDSSNVKIIIGKNKSANFVNYFVLDSDPIFTAYISITPSVPKSLIKPLSDRVTSLNRNISYYISNSQNIPKGQKKAISLLTDEFSKQISPKFRLIEDKFVYVDEFSASIYSIPRALERVFRVYQPISTREYREQILKSPKSPYDYLKNKYNDIFIQLNVEKRYTLNDIMAVFSATQKKSDIEGLFQLAELTIIEYPNTTMGHYFKGLAYEMEKNYKKALKSYERAYTFNPIDFITKEIVFSKIQSLK